MVERRKGRAEKVFAKGLAVRFDMFVAGKLGISRNKALELIENKGVLLNGKAYKGSFCVNSLLKNAPNEAQILNFEGLKLEILDEIYPSRAALKLKGFLQDFELNVAGKNCLDIGSAAGGFTQIWLENGASSVVALDVGSNQLDLNLKKDKRVQSVENTDIKDYESEQKFELISCDVSFVSLKKLLCHIDRLAQGLIVLLFKPQFEVGLQAKRDKKGVVKDEKAINTARADFEKECARLGWLFKGVAASKIKGKEGNVEYFYLYSKH